MMILYANVGSNDVPRSARFYDAALGALGYVRHTTNDTEVGYAAPGDPDVRLWVLRPFDGKPAHFGNGAMLCFAAPSRAAVDAFYQQGLANGGTDEGKPGLRYGPNFYTCYLRDPEGNKLSAVFDQPVS